MFDEFENRPARPSLFAACAMYLLSVAGLLIVNFFFAELYAALTVVFPALRLEDAMLILNGAFYALFMVIPVCLYAKSHGEAAQSYRLGPLSFRLMIVVVCLALLGVLLTEQISYFWLMLLQKLKLDVFYDTVYTPENTAGLLSMVVSTAMLPGICEELLFRGVVMGAWERRGTKRAILASAALFTLLHGSITGLPTQFLLGVTISFLAWACDSIYAAMIYHTMHNAAMLTLQFIASGTELTQEQLKAEALAEKNLFAYFGGWPGVLQMALQTAVLAFMFIWILRVFFRYARTQGRVFEPAQERGIGPGETVVLVSALVTVLAFYFEDMLGLLGRLQV